MVEHFSVTDGVLAGVIATVLMTVVMIVLGRLISAREPMPSAVFWSRFIDRDIDPKEAIVPGFLLHLCYGGLVGAIFVLFTSEAYLSVMGLSSLTVAMIWGAVLGLLLFVFGTIVWLMIFLGVQPDLRRGVVLVAAHLVYGLTVGALLSPQFSL